MPGESKQWLWLPPRKLPQGMDSRTSRHLRPSQLFTAMPHTSQSGPVQKWYGFVSQFSRCSGRFHLLPEYSIMRATLIGPAGKHPAPGEPIDIPRGIRLVLYKAPTLPPIPSGTSTGFQNDHSTLHITRMAGLKAHLSLPPRRLVD